MALEGAIKGDLTGQWLYAGRRVGIMRLRCRLSEEVKRPRTEWKSHTVSLGLFHWGEFHTTT